MHTSSRPQPTGPHLPAQTHVRGMVVSRHPTVPVTTARRMVEMVANALHDPAVLEVAKAQVKYLATENTHRIASKFSEIGAIHGFARTRLRYTRDPRQLELVYDAPATLRQIQKHGVWSEDCDSYAVLVMTLLAAIGHKVRLALGGFVPGHKLYSHVFCEAHIPGMGWVVVDPSMGPRVERMAHSLRETRHFYLPEPRTRSPLYQAGRGEHHGRA